MKKLLVTVAGILLLGLAQAVVGDDIAGDKSTPSNPAAIVNRIQSQLESQYSLAKTTSDGTDIVAAGSVLVLQKDNLVLNKVYLNNGTQRSSPVQNVYEEGKIAQVGFLGALSNINLFLTALGGPEPQARSFGLGEKLWVTRIAVQSDGIVFQLMSDPINNMRYHGMLKFPYETLVAADQAAVLVANVLMTESPPTTTAANAAAETKDQGASVPDSTPSAPAPVVDEREEIRRAAERGDINAMYQLGNGLAQDGKNVDAVRWFRQASDGGHVKATNALGFMYEEGRGVPQNYDQASKLYLKAMKNGDPDAMVNRGVMLAQGKGTTANPLQAYMHFLLAAAYAQDTETRNAAVKLKDETAAKLSKQQIARGQDMADKFAKNEIK